MSQCGRGGAQKGGGAGGLAAAHRPGRHPCGEAIHRQPERSLKNCPAAGRWRARSPPTRLETRTKESTRCASATVIQTESEAGQAIQNEDYSAAMRALAALREPIDSFFEHVLVNDEDDSVRANRLALLARIRSATAQVADFSRIVG